MPRTFFTVATLAVLIVVLAAAPVAGARPPRPPPPEGAAWQAWREAIAARFSYRQVDFERGDRPVLAGGRDGCPKGPFQRPGMSARVHSPNRQIFGELTVSIYALEETGDGNAYLKQASVTHARGLAPFPCIAVGDLAISMMQAGRFWVEATGSCADGDLYSYEVGEVLEMLRHKDPAGAPVTFAFSACGRIVPTVVPTDSFLVGLKQKKSFWGRTFPAARDAAKRSVGH